MNNKPLISVIIPSYNSARFVGIAVASALTQTYQPVEVIVVDDGSTDNTRAVLSPWQDRIRYFYQSNGGVSKARNRGIKEACGDLIAFLDADDVWLPEKLTKQWECLVANPQVGLVHTDAYVLNDLTGEQQYTYVAEREQLAGSCYHELFWCNVTFTSSILVTRACLNEVGGFDERRQGASVEDLDLWLRIARRHCFGYVNEPLVWYRIHLTNATRNRRLILETLFEVLDKAVRADPKLWNLRVKKRICEHIAAVAIDAAYANVEVGDLRRARAFYYGAVKYKPERLRVWVSLASTILPVPLRERLCALKDWLMRLRSRSGMIENRGSA
jgi:glycosyltransferase involved in cell wall biosynthesis